MRRIVFLDIDGVLNHAMTPKGFASGSPYMTWGELPHIDRECIKTINKLVEKFPDIEFVLSTAWRFTPFIKGHLRNVGFNGKVVGETELDASGSDIGYFRGLEIVEWLDKNAPEWQNGEHKVVILDDNPKFREIDTFGKMQEDFFFSFAPVNHLMVECDANSGGFNEERLQETIRRLS